MKVYISGPITGTDDYMVRFMEAQQYLENEGYEVVNPATVNSKLPDNTLWEVYMGESLKMLCECDAIYMLRNWMRSRGAKLEYYVAAYMNKLILGEGYL